MEDYSLTARSLGTLCQGDFEHIDHVANTVILRDHSGCLTVRILETKVRAMIDQQFDDPALFNAASRTHADLPFLGGSMPRTAITFSKSFQTSPLASGLRSR
jgi:hypothetical protein